MGLFKGLFGGGSEAAPQGPMPPIFANPDIFAASANRAKAAASSNSTAAPLAKPATTTQTSLLGG